MNTRKILYGLGLLLSVWMVGCKDLDDINHDPSKPSSTKPEYLFTYGEKNSSDLIYAGTQNGSIGTLYAQYWTGDAANSSRYALDEGSNGALWSGLYLTLNNLEEANRLNRARAATIPAATNQIACTWILKAWIYQILADAYGDIPFFETNQIAQTITPKYDDAKTVYSALIDTLQQQIALLDDSKPGFETGDGIFNGDVGKWRKFGNSLLLRLAIREVDANKEQAQQIIESVYDKAMTSNDDNAEFKYLGADPNAFPYNDSQRAIIAYYVSATLTDYQRSTKDPRFSIYARPAASTDTIRGMPYGQAESDTLRQPAGNYSYPGTKIYSASMSGILMQYSEVEFILAEAAARGFATGDAATHYLHGVNASLAYWGVDTASAAAQTFLAGVPYNAADWRNVVGTQKWLALYPQGLQGWFERNRLNFKKPGGDSLFKAPLSGILDGFVTFVPYRLSYPKSEQTLNGANYTSAVTHLGADNQGVKLWWNKL
ncbi:Starch-binding associating with outer membrane [Chitinophaga costaii]|uniref:Starch-binding associating with outer membrane n=1 Tax=Chitinophaga costaii TaxID=1335309 RepID=A0A1C4DVE3_9BACT|nr:SusD/RagB family nutrient-binding outer membrane lipoprotein [Chitinophaga costaii]PUZ27818.1 SusD/RagB family nutrient-binding outer membrane lipoprotein [Chitinophaga costaii]SCC35328.1 Starch-binding associating with outer membrane [Chitinophaga costaii]